MSSFLTETPLKSNQNQNAGPVQNAADDYQQEISLSRKIEFDRGNPLSFDFPSNKVNTIQYSVLGFFYFLWIKIANTPFPLLIFILLIFTIIIFLASNKEVDKEEIFYYLFFHLFILIIEIILGIFDFIKIYLNDLKINNQKTLIYNLEEKKFIEKKWKDIKVGNIIRVNQDEVVPADIIILESMDHNHQCFLDYSSITGNFDSFVMKRACSDTHAPSMKQIKFSEYVKTIKGILKLEEPNSNLHAFNGRLKLESFPRASVITEENFILRGSTIKNVRWLYGLVVYTGMETKVMQTLRFSVSSKSNVSNSYYGSKLKNSVHQIHNFGIIKNDRDIIGVTFKFIQYLLIGLYLIIVLISVLIQLHKAFLCYYSFLSPIGDDHYYLEFYSVDQKNIHDSRNNKHSPFYELYISFIYYLLTFQMILPFNWFGVMGVAYTLFALFIKWDYKVLLNGKNQVEIINQNCIANFGQIKHILTDKTGTLTSRKFRLRVCSIHGKLYSFDQYDQKDENYIFRVKEKDDFSNLEIFQEIHSNSKMSPIIKEFFEYLSLCHSVRVLNRNKEDKKGESDKSEISVKPTGKNQITFGSCYAEERAMLKTFKKLGYKMVKTKNNLISLEIEKERKVYYILGHNKFTEERQRMSVIVKSNATQSSSILLCKGNDLSILKLVKKTPQSEQEINKTIMQIKEMKKYGLRCFIFCKRILSEEETINFLTRYKSAENYVVKSEEHLHNLAIEFENNLEFMGVLFFEEKVSNDLKLNIAKLNKSNIKVWIASGDKRDNVISVGQNIGIYNPNTIKGDFSDKDKPEDLDIKMSMLLMQFLFPNEKINKMKTRKGVSVEAQVIKGSSKDLTILISGACFSRICMDQRNFQSLATLLSYCTSLLAYQFTPNNKYVLCQMIKKYVSKNSKVLAVGDGFNDFMMLKEADLSIGIRSREILQVRNTCDVIVNNFSQIVDLVLVHGTWDFSRLLNISLLSFYTNFIIIFPMFLHQNANPIGTAFYIYNPVRLLLEIFIMNLFVLFAFCFDYPIERSLISLNSSIYKQNFYDKKGIFLEFGLEFIRAGADSLILYYLFFAEAPSVNKLGVNADQDVLGNFILYTSYSLIFLKVFFLRLRTINLIQVCIAIIAIGCLVGTAFIGKYSIRSVVEGFTFLPMFLISLLVLGICFLYEYLGTRLVNTFNENFISKISRLLVKSIKENLLFKNYQLLFNSIAKELPSIISTVDKITYPEVLEKIYKENKVLDPALENMADVTNEEVANLKIRKPLLSFYDRKMEEDFIEFSSRNLKKGYSCYLASLALFWVVDVALEKFEDQKVTKIIKLVYLALGLLLFVEPIFKKFHKFFPVYLFILMTCEIVCIYVEKADNDTKICIQSFFVLSFPLYFLSKRTGISFALTIYYSLGITPAVYLNEFGFKVLKKEPYFLYSNLPLLYHRNVFIYALVVIMVIYAYKTELNSRIEFLKFYKSEVELKKDNQIIANLIPEFVREKIKKGERGAALGYEVVTIVFCDIYDFDSLVAKLAPKDLISFLDEFYSVLDQFCMLHGLQKIETVGKTYMAAGGIKECEVDVDSLTLASHHAIRCFEFGIDILDLIQKMVLTSGDKIKVKIGIHLGKVIPAVVGNHKPQFSLIGDTVNTTARMCAYSTENCINCSEFAYEEIKQKYKDFSVSTKEVKGKGMMNLYLYNPLKHKKVLDSKMVIPMDASGNYIMKSVTKNCQVLVKQGTKGSTRGGGINRNNTRNFNDFNETVNSKKDFSTDNSMLIVENSIDNLLDTNNQNNKLNLNLNGDFNRKQQQSSQVYTRKKSEEIEEMKNEYFNDSYLFFKFTNEVSKNGFVRFEKLKLARSEDISVYINLIFFFMSLIGIYLFSQYAFISDDPFSLFIALNAIILVGIVALIYETKVIIKNYPLLLSYFNMILFILYTVINQVEMNEIGSEFFSNLACEEILTIVTVSNNGLLNYLQLSFTYLILIIIFIVNICLNLHEHLIIKYNLFLILLCIAQMAITIISYYNSTMDFLLNQTESKTLETTEKILFNLIPLHVVQNMKDDIPVADVLDTVTLLFADIVRFTDFSACHEPIEVVNMVSELFMRFDNSTKLCSVYKVHTIGDCYVVMGFNGKVPMNERNYYEEAKNVCKMGEEMIKIIREVRKKVNFEKLDMRIGIHTGAVIAGIIGSSVVRYDIFGSDVLIANKMESSGCAGRVNISEDTKKLLETKEVPYNLTLNKVVQVPSVNREVKCYLIDNTEENAK